MTAARPNSKARRVRRRAELAFGGPLPPGAFVHHADGSKSDDAPLVICPNVGYHNLLHARMRVQAAGGDPNTQRICGTCQQLLLIEDMTQHKGKPKRRCKACHRRIMAARRA